ncbi:MAG: Glutamine amidotransferase subunit PdxT [Candidatus Heimdallarchaeota archaeon LC_2]|nr:MAG: Glutamine amidotransferase subunit PdxT [Candidatus Heimdallarchaeota archaeon LC_2]
MINLKIGILSLQGAIEEHERSIKNAADKLDIKIEIKRVIVPSEIDDIDGLVMPGGESSAMILIGSKNGMLDAVNSKIKEGLPVFGTCAGAILLSKIVRRDQNSDSKEGAFPFLNVEILRNGYGRQIDSFITMLDLQDEEEAFEGVFIRAPRIRKIGEKVHSYVNLKNDPVFIREGNIIVTTFHPELTGDSRIHELFLKLIIERA